MRPKYFNAKGRLQWGLMGLTRLYKSLLSKRHSSLVFNVKICVGCILENQTVFTLPQTMHNIKNSNNGITD